MTEPINTDRRRFLGAAAMTLAAAELGLSGSADARSGPVGPSDTASRTPGSVRSFGEVKQIHAGVLDVGYAEAGPAGGPAVILLHGWPYDIHTFVDVTPLLAARGYRVIVPYLRGLWYDALPFERNDPEWSAIGNRFRYHRLDGCAQDREGDPSRV